MEVLLHELKLVSNVAPYGSHTIVASNCGISMAYLYQIRTGNNMTSDTIENRKTMQELIDKYRVEIRKEQRRLKNI